MPRLCERVCRSSVTVITGHHIALTSLAADHASGTVRVRVETDAVTAATRSAHVRLTAPSGRTFETELRLGADGAGTTEFELIDPELWWTHDLGEPVLHEASVELREGDAVVDTVTDRIGLRTIELDRGTTDSRRFQFVLNGVPVFARGAAWLPASTLVGSVSAQTQRDRVLRAREGNLNMLRVWGGGIYEHDAFYAACDELGVLVWQDFMFACVDYPDADAMLRREVELEAAYQVRRLRNRASLALWAGNNEVQVLHLAAYQSVDEGDWGWHFFMETLPAAVAAHDGLTPYWPGSPYGEGQGILSINGTDDGDRHTWEVWHGMVIPGMTIGPDEYPTIGDARHWRRYAYDTARFVSEFGIHAAPERATLQRWLGDELEVHSPVFDLHNKDTPKDKGDELLAVTTGLPQGIDEYIAFTQAAQAEGMLFGIEHYRRRQPETAGALMWQFNDVWPGFSWSIIDFDGVPKAAYYAARRASAPVAVSFTDTADGGLELWLVNNAREAVDVDIDVEIGAFDGSDRATRRVIGRAETGQSVRVLEIPTIEVPRDARHYAWASSPSGVFPAARKHFAEVGALELPTPELSVVGTRGGLQIASRGYAYQVRIEHTTPGMRLSDNCFDLRDGDQVDVTVAGVDPASLTVTSYRVARR
ncbi:glycoside hydrolase family 2 protein [Gryllotalpicola protaetiae]|uniref:beta-mannosidase n=1 Tax=Gryllotalpicola protaetiae TaxID=2419771 RepID=A0A387BF94_9MICO|nr:glycoside hydrolase family 2 protein [Gryllotalpicola protaetiae]AYG02665.1 glycoside hydrolase family 2 protein [Gryllotalpicola protaetiae]